MKHLKDFLRLDVGKTLAMTVGSPSAHRRNSRLKHLAFMLLFLLGGIGNVWGDNCTLTSAQIKAGSGSTSYGSCSATDGCSKTWNAYAIKNKHSNSTSDYEFWQIKKYASNTAYYVQVPQMEGQITSLTITVSSSSKSRTDGSNSATLYFSSSNSTSDAGTGVASGTGASSVTINCSSLNLTSGYITASGAVRIWDVEVTYSTGGGTPQPTVSADPEEITDVVVEGVTNQTIDLTYENITGYITEATVHPYADGTGTLSPAWLSASVSDADNYGTVTYSVSANDGVARTAYIKVYSIGDDDKEATTIIPVSQVKYVAPTGTFNKYTSATLVDGYYVICSGTSTNAMKNEVKSSRLDVATVTISNNTTITNPDESVIWKLENLSGDNAGYFTLYNEAVEKYAAFTSSNGNANLIASVTDYARFNHVSETSYEFQNKGQTGKNLRYNSGYGFASYSTQTGAALTLYKKASAPKAVTINTNIANGSVDVTGATDLSSVVEGTELTLSNTPASGYKLTAYDVYKTDDSETKVTVTNNKFTIYSPNQKVQFFKKKRARKIQKAANFHKKICCFFCRLKSSQKPFKVYSIQ